MSRTSIMKCKSGSSFSTDFDLNKASFPDDMEELIIEGYTVDNAQGLAAFITSNHKLRVLRFRAVDFGQIELGMLALMTAMGSHPALQQLNFFKNTKLAKKHWDLVFKYTFKNNSDLRITHDQEEWEELEQALGALGVANASYRKRIEYKEENTIANVGNKHQETTSSAAVETKPLINPTQELEDMCKLPNLKNETELLAEMQNINKILKKEVDAGVYDKTIKMLRYVLDDKNTKEEKMIRVNYYSNNCSPLTRNQKILRGVAFLCLAVVGFIAGAALGVFGGTFIGPVGMCVSGAVVGAAVSIGFVATGATFFQERDERRRAKYQPLANEASNFVRKSK